MNIKINLLNPDLTYGDIKCYTNVIEEIENVLGKISLIEADLMVNDYGQTVITLYLYVDKSILRYDMLKSFYSLNKGKNGFKSFYAGDKKLNKTTDKLYNVIGLSENLSYSVGDKRYIEALKNIKDDSMHVNSGVLDLDVLNHHRETIQTLSEYYVKFYNIIDKIENGRVFLNSYWLGALRADLENPYMVFYNQNKKFIEFFIKSIGDRDSLPLNTKNKRVRKLLNLLPMVYCCHCSQVSYIDKREFYNLPYDERGELEDFLEEREYEREREIFLNLPYPLKKGIIENRENIYKGILKRFRLI